MRLGPPEISELKLLLLLPAALLLAAACAGGSETPPLEQRVHELNKTIMCPVCPGESIDQSQNTLAVQMRGIVREKLEEGWTDDQIRDFFVERYGPSVLMEPPRRGFSLAAWIVPPLAVAVAALAFFFTLRRMRRRPPEQSEGIERSVKLSDEELAMYYARVEAALERADGHASSTEDTGSRGAGQW